MLAFGGAGFVRLPAILDGPDQARRCGRPRGHQPSLPSATSATTTPCYVDRKASACTEDQARGMFTREPDARAIADELTTRQISLSLGGSVYNPTDAVGRLLFNVSRWSLN